MTSDMTSDMTSESRVTALALVVAEVRFLSLITSTLALPNAAEGRCSGTNKRTAAHHTGRD